ncbi:hypothetical protein D3C81_1793620 [compost metagenome]
MTHIRAGLLPNNDQMHRENRQPLPFAQEYLQYVGGRDFRQHEALGRAQASHPLESFGYLICLDFR